MDTKSPEIYSKRPCPNGWSESGLCPAILNPIRVMIEDPASDKLLKASAIIAIELLNKPTHNFPINRRRLKQISDISEIVKEEKPVKKVAKKRKT